MKIFTTDEELRILIGAAAEEICEEQVARNVKEEVIVNTAAILAEKLILHFQGKRKIDTYIIERAKEMRHFLLFIQGDRKDEDDD